MSKPNFQLSFVQRNDKEGWIELTVEDMTEYDLSFFLDSIVKTIDKGKIDFNGVDKNSGTHTQGEIEL